MSEQDIVNNVKAQVDARVDNLADAAKAAVNVASETPGEIAELLANVVGDTGLVVGDRVEDAIDLAAQKVKELTAIIAKLGGVVTG